MRELPSPERAAEILRRRRTRPVRRAPPSAGRAVARLVRRFDKQFGPSVGPLQARWREVVGETLWRVSEPVKLIQPRGAKADRAKAAGTREGAGATLELRVDGPAAAIVQHQAEDIIERVNLTLGSGAVARLRIVQGLIRRAARTGKPSRLRPPLDAAREAELAASLANAPDGPLKAALLKLGRAVFREE
jgi:hypothetical protein